MTNEVPGPARRLRLLAAVCVPLFLTACTPSDGVKELDALFDEEQQADDVLVDEVLDDVAVDGAVDAETTRRIGADGAATFYAARSDDGVSTCLVVVDENTDDGVASCSMTPNPTGTEVGNGKVKAMFVVPGTDFTSLEQSGWVRHGDFLAVR